MNPLIFFTIWVSLFHSHNCLANYYTPHNQNKYPAYIYKIPIRDIHFDGTKNVSHFTFCPATSEREKKINDQVSITGNGLFLRNVHGPEENITANICDEPIKPGMLYNSENNQYAIGYELYYEQDKFKWEEGAHYWENWTRKEPGKYQLGENKYHVYRPVNNRTEEITNDENKKCVPNDTFPKLMFHWTPVVSVSSSKYNKQIHMPPHFPAVRVLIFKQSDDTLRYKCDDYELPYTSVKMFDRLEKLNDTFSNERKLIRWNKQLHDSLKLSQIIPLWYFDESWAKMASCSHMNMIPVWKSIADGQLKKVDLYILAVMRRLTDNLPDWFINKPHFGTIGELKIKNESGIVSSQQRKIDASPENAQSSKIIPIPKIIYRVIEAEHLDVWYSAIVVIHIDPNPEPDNDRICDKSEEIEGWEAIKNDDPRTGLTYVCPYSMSKLPHLKLSFQTESEQTKPLRLNEMLYCADEEFNSERYLDVTKNINIEFEKLLNITGHI